MSGKGLNTRKSFDKCYTDEQVRITIGPGNYNVNRISNDGKRCNVQNGVGNIRGTWYDKGVAQDLGINVSIESHLRNQDLPDSRCFSGRTMEDKNKYLAGLASKMQQGGSSDCSRILESEPTRLTRPVGDIRGATQSRYGFPIIDPKSFAYFGMGPASEQSGSSRMGVNSRLAVKDMSPAEYSKQMNDYRKNGI
jgi:hypothetical protein